MRAVTISKVIAVWIVITWPNSKACKGGIGPRVHLGPKQKVEETNKHDNKLVNYNYTTLNLHGDTLLIVAGIATLLVVCALVYFFVRHYQKYKKQSRPVRAVHRLNRFEVEQATPPMSALPIPAILNRALTPYINRAFDHNNIPRVLQPRRPAPTLHQMYHNNLGPGNGPQQEQKPASSHNHPWANPDDQSQAPDW